jgi:hypothetical protein
VVVNRQARAATVAVAALLFGCTPAPPSSPGATAIPIPTIASPIANARPYPVVNLPAADVRWVSVPASFQPHSIASFGPVALMDEVGYGDATGTLGGSIWVADLSAGTFGRFVTAGGTGAAWTPDIDERYAVWSEITFLDDPVNLTGRQAWAIKAMDRSTHRAWTVVTGHSDRLEGGAAPWVQFKISGDLIAYAEESDAVPGSLSWTITLRSLADPTPLRVVHTERSLYDLALSGTTIAYSEGLVDQAASFKYDTRLMVSTADHPGPTLFATDPFEIAIDGDRLTWINDWVATSLHLGLPARPQIYTATLSNPSVVDKISGLPDDHPIKRVVWPAAGDGISAWAELQDDVVLGPNVLVAWSVLHHESIQVAQGRGTAITGLGGGWLTWFSWIDGANGGTAQVGGIPVASINWP